MDSVDTMITDDDVYWLMTWGKQFPDKPETEMMFEEGQALARLLAEEVIFLNSHWWEKDWPSRAKPCCLPFFACLERMSSITDLASASIIRSLVPVQMMK